ncbi:hemerythrin domain-containing protein [Pseudomonadota bacterium]
MHHHDAVTTTGTLTTETHNGMEPIPENLLGEPVEYIFADHCRQMEMCEAVLNSTEDTFAVSPSLARILLLCLDNDLRLHFEDEEQDLFPRLRARALAEDRFEDMLYLMQSEHAHFREMAKKVRDGLKASVVGAPVAEAEAWCKDLRVLAHTYLNTLKWENAAVLALARKRLSSEDTEALGQAMTARRKVPAFSA